MLSGPPNEVCLPIVSSGPPIAKAAEENDDWLIRYELFVLDGPNFS